MRTIIFTSLLLIVLNAPARSADCPDFYRFVDFGLTAADGTIHRGGPTYRAEGFDGQALLIRELTVCRNVRDLSVDGRGNPVPVVESVNYDPEQTGTGLEELRLEAVSDVVAETERAAAEHRSRLERDASIVTTGSTYLCAGLSGSDQLSCQLVSPFGGNLALVVYCTRAECRVPALAVKANIIAQAAWVPSDAAVQNPAALASEIAERLGQIHGFLDPLSA